MSLLRDGSIAVLAGFIAAFLNYLFGRVFLRPRLKYSERIRLRHYNDKEIAQIKLLNGSYWRSITNLQISASVILPFSDNASGNKRRLLRIRITPSAEEIPRLSPRFNRVITLDPSTLAPFAQQRLRSINQEALAENSDRTLTDLLDLSLVTEIDDSSSRSREDNRPRLMIIVNCKDSVTGRDFSLQCKAFHCEDLKRGSFEGTNESIHAKILRATLTRPVRKTTQWWQRHQQLSFKPDADQLDNDRCTQPQNGPADAQ